MRKKILLFISIILLISCEKTSNNDLDNNPNIGFVGNWNFKGNSFSYSGYYIYTPEAEWYSTSSSSTLYNDSTGSIQLGENANELIFKYCESCEEVVYDVSDNGFYWSENLGSNTGWELTDTSFLHIITPPPPSYSTSYSTYNIEGWKLQ